ncbi:MAG: CBS domain-containing protein [Chromatiales bacterium]|jgi:signal-transduction protein with cAMP-binding, CBS, and nucleotidyltransferase domain
MPCIVNNYVRERLATLDEKSTAVEGSRLMQERDVGSVIVTRNDEVLGIFTQQDMMRRVINRGQDPATISIGEVCSTNLVTITADASCREAILKMRANGCHRLFVYRGSQFLGLVKLHDLANGIAVQEKKHNWLPNLIVGLTVALVVVVIILLVFQLPEMLNIYNRTHG